MVGYQILFDLKSRKQNINNPVNYWQVRGLPISNLSLLLSEVTTVVISKRRQVGARASSPHRKIHNPLYSVGSRCVSTVCSSASDLAGKNNCQYHSPQAPAGRLASNPSV
ncbi:hypothetical protein NPIL_492771 [Nephila pilipes]|uniref:Uncharacterized protein n=1 Tax=Nephila pilipes TaxID=299642 RepID=A0A8X6ND98_NEPPI|nr:hypothetical protein NPIL_492771 [Nephila pilipes]